MAYDVSKLSAYVAENKDLLVKEVLFGGAEGDTIANLTKQLGIKTSENIHSLNLNPTLQNGKGCGFNAQGDTEITERVIETAAIKVNEEWCPDDLLAKYAEYLVRLGADANAETLPFEAEIVDALVAGINKKMETLVWAGNKDNGDLINGFLKIANDESDKVDVNISGMSALEAAKAIVKALPEDIIDDAVIFMSPAKYRDLVLDLVDKNYYKYDAGNTSDEDVVIPGTSVRVHKTLGLAGKSEMFASAYANMFYGADAMNDKEEVRIWFSDDDDKFKLKVKFNAGVQVAFPDLVVYAHE